REYSFGSVLTFSKFQIQIDDADDEDQNPAPSCPGQSLDFGTPESRTGQAPEVSRLCVQHHNWKPNFGTEGYTMSGKSSSESMLGFTNETRLRVLPNDQTRQHNIPLRTCRLTMQMMKIKIPLQVVLVSLWISGLLGLELVKLQKFPGFACNTTIGSPTSGLKDTRCLVKAHQNLCWAARTKPDCVCCQTIRPDNTTFVYARADLNEGEKCLQDSQCPEGTKCVSGICEPR
ncbi:unnamed protein product, partial [Cyprideis torosa]